MKTYTRKEPGFSLCGLNCYLCPRYHTAGASKCPGCGGPNFYSQHPSCAVINCNERHDKVEYCFECSEFPCDKYRGPADADSFISYRNVGADMAEAGQDIEGYMCNLRVKLRHLETLLENYDDGRSKGFYCRAVNLLPLPELEKCLESVASSVTVANDDAGQRANRMRDVLESKAKELGIDLSLRKKG